MTARERYPNLAALAQGCVSGRISEWPNLQREAEEVLAELAQREVVAAGLLGELSRQPHLSHLCPKCQGYGQLHYDPNMPFATGNTNAGPWSCPACLNGIIWV